MEMLRCDDSSVAYINFYPRYNSLHIGKNWVLFGQNKSLFLRDNAGSLERARQAIFFLSGSQSERGICFILFFCAASLVKNMNIATNSYLEIR